RRTRGTTVSSPSSSASSWPARRSSSGRLSRRSSWEAPSDHFFRRHPDAPPSRHSREGTRCARPPGEPARIRGRGGRRRIGRFDAGSAARAPGLLSAALFLSGELGARARAQSGSPGSAGRHRRLPGRRHGTGAGAPRRPRGNARGEAGGRARGPRIHDVAAIFFEKHPELGGFLGVPQALTFVDGSGFADRLRVLWASLAERWDLPGGRQAVDRVLRDDYLRGLAGSLEARGWSATGAPPRAAGTAGTPAERAGDSSR